MKNPTRYKGFARLIVAMTIVPALMIMSPPAIAGATATHTVTFNPNGGTGSMSPEAAKHPTALSANTFTRAGYTFAGWNTAANGSGTPYADGATYPFSASATLYAQWSAIATYTVTFNPNGGTGSMSPEVSSVADRAQRQHLHEGGLHLRRLEHRGQRLGHPLRRRRDLPLQRERHPLRPVERGRHVHRHLQPQRGHRLDEPRGEQRSDRAQRQHLHEGGLHLRRLEHRGQRLGHPLRRRRDLPLQRERHPLRPVERGRHAGSIR